jgi:hypothetical protein
LRADGDKGTTVLPKTAGLMATAALPIRADRRKWRRFMVRRV